MHADNGLPEIAIPRHVHYTQNSLASKLMTYSFFLLLLPGGSGRIRVRRRILQLQSSRECVPEIARQNRRRRSGLSTNRGLTVPLLISLFTRGIQCENYILLYKRQFQFIDFSPFHLCCCPFGCTYLLLWVISGISSVLKLEKRAKIPPISEETFKRQQL